MNLNFGRKLKKIGSDVFNKLVQNKLNESGKGSALNLLGGVKKTESDAEI